jgi:hypothetical protein
LARHRSGSARRGNITHFHCRTWAVYYLAQLAAIATKLQRRKGVIRSRVEIIAAEDRVRQLELEAQILRDRAFHAEKWLLRVYKEIEGRFSIKSPSPKLRLAAANYHALKVIVGARGE